MNLILFMIISTFILIGILIILVILIVSAPREIENNKHIKREIESIKNQIEQKIEKGLIKDVENNNKRIKKQNKKQL